MMIHPYFILILTRPLGNLLFMCYLILKNKMLFHLDGNSSDQVKQQNDKREHFTFLDALASLEPTQVGRSVAGW